MNRRVGMVVRGFVTRFRRRWRHIGHRHLRVMRKLDQSKIHWIIRQKGRGTPNLDIACIMDISVRHVQRIYAAYASTGIAPVLRDSGRPRRGTAPDEVEVVLKAHKKYCCGAVYLERILAETEAIHMPHNTMHLILRDNGLASGDPAKQGRRSWVRYERTYSNYM